MRRTSDVTHPRARKDTGRRAMWALLALLAGGTGTAHGAIFSARVRWLPSAGSGVIGYRVYQRILGGSYGTPYDAGLPQPAADGTLGYTVNGLDTAIPCVFMMTAYDANGSASAASNEITLAAVATSTTTTTSIATTTTKTTTTTTSTTLAGGALQAAPDWTGAFRAVFDLDEASGTRRNASAATCGASCNLDDVGAVGRYTAGNPDGAGAADLVRATPPYLGKWLTSSNGFAVSGSLSIGCWARPTMSGVDAFMIGRENGANAGYRLYRTSSDRYAFVIGDGTDREFCSVGSPGQFARDQWQHVGGVFDDDSTLGGGIDRMYVFANGSQVGASCTQQGLAATDWTFRLGHGTSSYDWQGQLDECFVRAGALTAAQVCRIKSCGIDGTRCTCAGAAYAPCTSNASCGGEGICDPTSNTCRGRNGGTCGLPACNAAAPSSGVPRLSTGPAGCEQGLGAARLLLRAAGGRRRVVALGAFAAGAALDPTATGATVQVTGEDGAVLYEASLPGTAFRQRRGRGGLVS